MGRHTSTIPVAPVHKLLKVQSFKVSRTAAQKVAVHLEEFAEEIAQHAHKIAVHKGKKTIDKEDITLAYKQINAQGQR